MTLREYLNGIINDKMGTIDIDIEQLDDFRIVDTISLIEAYQTLSYTLNGNEQDMDIQDTEYIGTDIFWDYQAKSYRYDSEWNNIIEQYKSSSVCIKDMLDQEYDKDY